MPLTQYSYTQADFPSQKINPSKLQTEIQASAIITALDHIDTSGGTFLYGVVSGTFTVDIWFKDTLSVGDKTILDNNTTNPAGGLIAAHNNSIVIDNVPVDIKTSVHISPQTATINEVIDGYVGTSSASSVVIRATAYTPQGTNAQRSISSTSANDTSVGTGARTVNVTYLNASGDGPFTETITMNGTTAVDTVATDIALIEKMEVMTVGAIGGNVGTIRIHTTTAGGGSIWGSIAISDNRTYWAHHYVPINKSIYISALFASATTVAGSMTINMLNPVDTSSAQNNPIGTLRYNTMTSDMILSIPIKVTGPKIVFLNSRPDVPISSTSYGAFGYIQF